MRFHLRKGRKLKGGSFTSLTYTHICIGGSVCYTHNALSRKKKKLHKDLELPKFGEENVNMGAHSRGEGGREFTGQIATCNLNLRAVQIEREGR